MTVGAAAVSAREDARQPTGRFGIQAHAESGIIDGAMDPRIDVEAATDAVMAGCDVDFIDDFDDDREQLAKQIWDVHSVLARDEWLPGLSLEPHVGLDSLELYGLSVGIHDQTTDLVTQYDIIMQDLVPGIDFTSGRERAKTIVWGLATWHAELEQAITRRQSDMSDYYVPEVNIGDLTDHVIRFCGDDQFTDDTDDLVTQVVAVHRAIYADRTAPLIDAEPILNTDEFFLEKIQVRFHPPQSPETVSRSYDLDTIVPGISGTSGRTRAKIITEGLVARNRELVIACSARARPDRR